MLSSSVVFLSAGLSGLHDVLAHEDIQGSFCPVESVAASIYSALWLFRQPQMEPLPLSIPFSLCACPGVCLPLLAQILTTANPVFWLVQANCPLQTPYPLVTSHTPPFPRRLSSKPKQHHLEPLHPHPFSLSSFPLFPTVCFSPTRSVTPRESRDAA